MNDFEVWLLFVCMQSKRQKIMKCGFQGWCLGAKDAACRITLVCTRGWTGTSRGSKDIRKTPVTANETCGSAPHNIHLVTLNCWTSHAPCSPTNNGYLLWVVDLYDAVNKLRYYLHVSVASPNGYYCLPSAWLLESTKYLSTVADSTQLIYFQLEL
jgi:hypothetical protein